MQQKHKIRIKETKPRRSRKSNRIGLLLLPLPYPRPQPRLCKSPCTVAYESRQRTVEKTPTTYIYGSEDCARVFVERDELALETLAKAKRAQGQCLCFDYKLPECGGSAACCLAFAIGNNLLIISSSEALDH